jgi:xanthine dehydrogenase iron-sulfur cluster and FAD-binding subunit A
LRVWAHPKHLHPQQQSFINPGAVQGAFCTPGMLMPSAAFICKNPAPSHDEIKLATSMNLCRCTGNAKFIPPGPLDALQSPSWAADIQNNRMYGRGASDMKSGLAAMTIRSDVRLKRDVILEYTVDEEQSGKGTLACVMKGYQADAGICSETSSLQ